MALISSRNRRKSREPVPVFPIAAILEHYGATLPPERREWTPCRCPFHGEDKHPSAAVNFSANRFSCFVCQEKSQDAIGLLMAHEHLSFKEALSQCEQITAPIGQPKQQRPSLSSMF